MEIIYADSSLSIATADPQVWGMMAWSVYQARFRKVFS
jgi:hypothetical protein